MSSPPRRIACRLVERDGRGNYYDPDTGDPRPLIMAPPGTMWWADWLLSWSPGDAGPDGRFLVIMTPAGTWCPDRAGGTRYTRTGEPPRVSISPAFMAKRADDEPYRAALSDGVLVELDP